MRYALALAAAALLAPPAAFAADPPITFQAHPTERVLNDLRFAADLVRGEKAVKAFNDAIKAKLGEKGFEGLDLGKPVVGYVVLAPKLEESTAVVAFPVTNEKDFVAFCDRWNSGVKAKDLGKGLWEVPPLVPGLKARMRFANGYAYVALGTDPEPALGAKALVAPEKLYDPGEPAVFMGRLHFDRLTPEVKKALPAYAAKLKEAFANGRGLFGFGAQEKAILGPVMEGIEKMFARYALLMLGGADTATLRLGVNVPASDVFAEFNVKPKPGTPLAKELAARKPTGNKFAGLLTADTVAGFKTRLPFFNDELRAAGVNVLEKAQKEVQNAGAGVPKDLADEFFKGLIRTVKTGEFDIVAAARGPDKNGDFALVAAVAFEDPSALGKEFKKVIEKEAPPDEQARFKWDAAKAGNVSIHTYKFPGGGFLDPSKYFGGANCTLAFAFAPKGVFVVIGPDAVAVMKDALSAKPADSPVLDVVLNPARMGKFVQKTGGNALDVEKALGKEDKLVSAVSLKVAGGKELSVRLAINLRMLPRAVVSESSGAKSVTEPVPPPADEKK
jgi:hypothetical protein